MAKYDNSQFWTEYRDAHIETFLLEFKDLFETKERTMEELTQECRVADYKEIQSIFRRYLKEKEPLNKLRSRFRTYAYKQRNQLSSISISMTTKEKMDSLIGEHGYADYSDLIEQLMKHSNLSDL